MALYLLASIVISFLAGSSAPTPLYPVYQAEWHFSPITTTVIFGVYALAVLVSLLVVGRLSDHVGRRPVLFTAVIAQAVTMLVFATAGGVPELVLARIVQGLSTGAAVAAIGAGMLDIDRARGTVANAIAPLIGTALGALGSGVLVQYLPVPTRLVYLVLFGVFVLQAVGVSLMRETATVVPGARASLRPQFAVPRQARAAMLTAIPALVSTWALVGFYGSLGPALVETVLGSDARVLGGLALFVLAGSALLSVLWLRNMAAQALMSVGVLALAVGTALTLLGIGADSAAALFGGMFVAGAGFGGAFQGVIRTVVPLAAEHQRAGVLSVIYVVSYLSMGLPAVIAGVLVVDGGGVLRTAKEYALAVIVLAAVAGVGLLRTRRPAPVAVAAGVRSAGTECEALSRA